MGEKRVLLLRMSKTDENVQGVLELENHHLVTITVQVASDENTS